MCDFVVVVVVVVVVMVVVVTMNNNIHAVGAGVRASCFGRWRANNGDV